MNDFSMNRGNSPVNNCMAGLNDGTSYHPTRRPIHGLIRQAGNLIFQWNETTCP